VGVRDLTGGFKCFRRQTLNAIGYRDTHANGYGFQIESTYRAIQAGMRVVEIPIVFRDRQAGKSKMSLRIVLEAMWKVPALRLRARRLSDPPLTHIPARVSPQFKRALGRPRP
jgi:dolichol-phosphate mannosyltransferase